MLRVLAVHNSYQQQGGEDSVVKSEIALLRAHGNEVVEYRRSNEECREMSRLDLAVQALWSRRSTTELGQLFTKARPDVIHVHNTFPLISPSLYWAAAEAKIPVVQTLTTFAYCVRKQCCCVREVYARTASVSSPGVASFGVVIESRSHKVLYSGECLCFIEH